MEPRASQVGSAPQFAFSVARDDRQRRRSDQVETKELPESGHLRNELIGSTDAAIDFGVSIGSAAVAVLRKVLGEVDA